MSFATFAFLGWLLFGILFALATITAFTPKRLGRGVTREDVLLLFTKSIGAAVFGLVCGFVAGMAADHYLQQVSWLTVLSAIVVGGGAAAVSWKHGKARIR